MRTLGSMLLSLPLLMPAALAQSYSCPSGESFQLLVHKGGPKDLHAVLLIAGKPPLVLPQVVSASGARYSDGFTSLSTKGNEAMLESGAMNLKNCTTGSDAVTSLSGTWTLTELRGKAVTLQRAPFIEFNAQGGRAAGFAGCNRFSGNYKLTGAALAFGSAVATRMACPGEAMSVEDSFLKMLSEVASHQLTGSELKLLSSGGQILAVFRKQ